MPPPRLHLPAPLPQLIMGYTTHPREALSAPRAVHPLPGSTPAPRAPRLGFHPHPTQTGTSRHFLHEDLEIAALAGGAQVAHDVFVAQAFVKRDLFVQGLREPAGGRGGRHGHLRAARLTSPPPRPSPAPRARPAHAPLLTAPPCRVAHGPRLTARGLAGPRSPPSRRSPSGSARAPPEPRPPGAASPPPRPPGPPRAPHLRSRSGISLMAMRTRVCRSRPAYTTPYVPLPSTSRSPLSVYS